MADAQADDGFVPTTAPEYAKFKGTFRTATEWGSAFILVPWQQYQFTGDLDSAARPLSTLMKTLLRLSRNSGATDDIVSEGLGDCAISARKNPGAAQLYARHPSRPRRSILTDATILAQGRHVLLGRLADDARHYNRPRRENS